MTALAPELAQQDLETLVAQVWSTYVLDEGPLPAPPAPWNDASPCWSSAVSVTGAWHGMIAVDLAESAAVALTRAMLAMDDDEEPASEDLVDAVGELANMIGGNVKALVPGPSGLSLPVVGHSPLAAPSELAPTLTLDLTWRGTPLRVRVLTAGSRGESPTAPPQEMLP
ncbi:chemotaxis protein CheX [Nocardioides flavescens]|uniref:Chemotaxis protein CheX n=1 Tax=Nocardioides flavescens TaxID=2691959 RepID=A0A6L7EZY1_9ACTN|nr:chemotaxis protein CheX [Nocardioides flavescens]MXG87944.1 chemotaxis protein CheX [Nocardioides flavescens]